MPDILEDFAALSRDQLRDATGRIGSAGEKLSGLLLAGNGAALGLVMKASLDGSNCSPDYLHSAALPFVIGVGASFAAGVASWAGGLVLVKWLAEGTADIMHSVAIRREIAALEAQGIPTTPESPLGKMQGEQAAKLTAYKRRHRRIMAALVIPMSLYAVSAGSFVDGVLAPLRDGLSCSAEKASPTVTLPRSALPAPAKPPEPAPTGTTGPHNPN